MSPEPRAYRPLSIPAMSRRTGSETKNDANDAAAICAAAQRPDMRFVRLRSQRQSDVQALHKVREGLVTEKTATVNRVRSLLAENGIVITRPGQCICPAAHHRG